MWFSQSFSFFQKQGRLAARLWVEKTRAFILILIHLSNWAVRDFLLVAFWLSTHWSRTSGMWWRTCLDQGMIARLSFIMEIQVVSTILYSGERRQDLAHPDPIIEVPPCYLSCIITSPWAYAVHSSPQLVFCNSHTNMSWISPPLSQIILKNSSQTVTSSTDST